MKVRCPNCKTFYSIDSSKLPQKRAYVRCPKCRTRFLVKKELKEEDTFTVHEPVTCPNCGYEQNMSDSCIRCGIVFSKYKKKEVPQTSEKGQKRDFPSSTGQEKKIRNRTKLIIFICLTLMLIILGVIITHSRFTTKGIIKQRWQKYNEAGNRLDVKESYECLTPRTKELISEEEWEKKILKLPLSEESIEEIRPTNDPNIIVLDINRVLKSGDVWPYTQTWKKLNGLWFRAYGEDHEEELIEKLKKKKEEEEIRSVMFELVGIETRLKSRKDKRHDQNLLIPETTLRVKNTGTVPINYLRLLVVYKDMRKNRIFSKVEECVVGYRDLPLEMGLTSEKLFFKSSIGYVQYDFFGTTQDLISEEIVTIEIYYKLRSSDEWTILE